MTDGNLQVLDDGSSLLLDCLSSSQLFQQSTWQAARLFPALAILSPETVRPTAVQAPRFQLHHGLLSASKD